MPANPDRKREALYFDIPDLEEIEDKDRYSRLTGLIVQHMFLYPSLSFSRYCWGELLWKMWNTNEPMEEGNYDSLDVLMSIWCLQGFLTQFGLLLGSEVETIRDMHERPKVVNPAPKYATWAELEEQAEKWKNEGKTVGLVHGSFDPPHIGHGRLIACVWPYCDVLLAGFDPNWLLRERKGPDRPRFPQLAWRMWEVASLPTVDNVFVLPVSSRDDRKYFEIYRRLGVRVMGTSADNIYLPQYRERMAQLDGHVIVEDPFRWSSTRLIGDLSNQKIQERVLLSKTSVKSEARRIQKEALAAGYLRDYPNGTWVKPRTR